MNLDNLLKDLNLSETYNEEVNEIQYDSRKVTKGDVFVAIKGFSVDGHKFIDKAIESGAKVIVGEDDITVEEFLRRINEELPKGVEFIKAKEISSSTPTLSSEIVYGEYLFNIDLPKPLSKELVKSRVLDFIKRESIMITKKNKKGKLVENDIRPLIKTFDLVSLDDERATFEAIIATGSKGNLNINILIPMLLEILDVEMDQREVETIRRDLYAMKDGELVTPL